MSAPVVAAYYPSWKIYKGCKPSDLRLGLLSYVCYAFARIGDDGRICSLDAFADFSKPVDGAAGCIGALVKLKREQYPHLRLLLSIGGASGSKPFPAVVADNGKLRTFCESVRDLLQKHDLDGVDIDWEHPSNPHEGEMFSNLLFTLRAYLPRPRYTLTAALPAGEWCLSNINLSRLLSSADMQDPCLDYLHVMTYDFSGPWTELSGHQAQLHAPAHPPNAFAKRSIARATDYLVNEQCVDPSRLIIGVPVYGRSFLGVSGPGEKFSGHAGDTSGIFEYRDLPRPEAEERVDEDRGAAWCCGDDGGWVSYDCPATVRQKGQFVKEHGLGGLFFWTGSFDAPDENRSLVVAGYKSLNEQ